MADDEREIANALVENARLSSRQLAKKTGISPSTAIKKMREMEKSGLIKGYAAVLDYFKAGYDFQAIIDVKVSKGKLFEVERRIARQHNVQSVYDVTGNFDVVVIAKFRSRSNLDKFLKEIQSFDFVERTETKIVLNILKEGQIKI